ncbi:uncharacterized protein LOC141915131 [Tubulanus polymorphus]|uniref:uncharacterized protein LOC141915131 n=1 Tax=Tubulanus polymorphus TaxID=672921 RepID=UPI003DA5AE74
MADRGAESPPASPTTPGPMRPTADSSLAQRAPDQPRVTRFIELDEDTPCCLRYITLFSRLWGVVLVAALWASTIKILEAHKGHIFIGWYLLGAAILTSLLELIWLIDKCICCPEDRGCCCCLWKCILWLDNWRKTIIYTAAAIPCFIKTVLLGVICGVFMLVAAMLYFVKSFKYCRCTKKTHRHASYMEVSSPQVSLIKHEVTQPTDPGENGDIKPQDAAPEPKPGVPNDMNTSYQQYDEEYSNGQIVPEK